MRIAFGSPWMIMIMIMVIISFKLFKYLLGSAETCCSSNESINVNKCLYAESIHHQPLDAEETQEALCFGTWSLSQLWIWCTDFKYGIKNGLCLHDCRMTKEARKRQCLSCMCNYCCCLYAVDLKRMVSIKTKVCVMSFAHLWKGQ